jgi:hypothetical protein
MAGVPIASNIESNMVALIKGMNQGAGYNYDWDTVNEIDMAIGSFPRAVIDSPIESSIGRESNVDTLNGQHSDAYTNELVFTIQIRGEISITSINTSYFSIRDILRRALDDLKMLFAINNTVNDTCDTIMYRDSELMYIPMNDILKPAELKTSWLCTYSQDRENPSQYASS